METNKKVLLTGVTGLVGKEVIKPLQDLGYEISALTIDDNNPDNGVKWIKCNLFDDYSVKKAFEQVKPTHLLNFAWATTGDYLTSDINFEFVKAGLNLLKHFKANGGKRAVFVGTCFEYQFKDEPLKETDSTNPQTLYAVCKDALHRMAEEYYNVYYKKVDSKKWGRTGGLVALSVLVPVTNLFTVPAALIGSGGPNMSKKIDFMQTEAGKEMMKYYRRAAELGHEEAKKRVEELKFYE